MYVVYNGKLNQILTRYGIEIIEESKLNDNLDLSVKGILTENCAGKRCALWGAGRMNTTSSHAAILIGKYATYLQNLVCIIDSDPQIQGKEFLGYPIIAPEEIVNYDIEIVVISSKNSSTSIIESLRQVSPYSKYVDIYGELRKKGIEVFNNFFDERSIYTYIYDLQNRYRMTETASEKEEILQKLIEYYFSIRDFYFANYYLDQYISNKYRNYKEYIALRKEVEQLLEEIRAVNEEKTEDVSIFYIDALRAKDVFDEDTGDIKMFHRYAICADIYTNVYSVGATTYESMVSSILGKYPLECDVYSKNFLRKFEEFALLQKVYNSGYKINWMVSDCYRLIEDDEKADFDIQIYMSKKLWNLVCSIAESNQKTFNFVYFPYEIHCPMLCGFHSIKPVIRGFSNIGIEDFPESIEQQYQDCLFYTDKQFDFYYELLGKNTKKIIFSDHSQVVYDRDNNCKSYNMYYKYKELTSHIPVIVSKETKEMRRHDDFYSMVDMNQLFWAMIRDQDVTALAKDIIRYQYYPIHSAKIRTHCKNHGFEDYIEGMDIFASKDYIYIKTGTGIEELYRHTNLNTNIITTEEGQAFKSLVVSSFNQVL